MRRAPAQEAGRKEKHSGDEGQKRTERRCDQPEGEKEQPNDRIEDEGQDSHRPRQYQQDAPQQEPDEEPHGNVLRSPRTHPRPQRQSYSTGLTSSRKAPVS